jgi:Na+(H+)/acetate symporter ActP
MKFVIDYGTGTVWTLIMPPSVLLWAAAILAVLIMVKWHYALKNREIQSRELKEIRDDHREKEIAGLNSEGAAGHRFEGSGGANDKYTLHGSVSGNLQ